MVGFTKYKIAGGAVLLLGFGLLVAAYLHGTNIAVLNPKGPVAEQVRNLLIFALVLSLVVVVPVFAMTFAFAWKYREGNTKAKYSPELDGSRIAETIWWAIPSLLIFMLSVVAWNSSHALDPFQPLASTAQPITIQVVALDWKWLFIYPQQRIATVNFVQFPENTPINFQITSDAPMNSFWIPQLGGQIYAMPGMSTQLHLMASQAGSFNGSSANISGAGFSGMTFVAKASSQSEFDQWVQSAAQSPSRLDQTAYNSLAKPSQNSPIAYYSLGNQDLYNMTLMKYMSPTDQVPSIDSSGTTQSMPGMDMQNMGAQ